ncbi:MAG TPA: ATP-binding cassette domain-containing protein [Streptosporangiaceae bacterium]|nr:ATP-binding cassette domain-containing protein [Streptosporangiaceae bacterium]
MRTNEAVLELSAVAKSYPGSPPVQAIEDVDLLIDAAERMAILGPSGSGKTTLLHILGILERPTRGTVRVAQTQVSSLSDAELSAVRAYQIGFVFQHFHLLDHLNAIDNVALALIIHAGLAVNCRGGQAALLILILGSGYDKSPADGPVAGGSTAPGMLPSLIAGMA